VCRRYSGDVLLLSDAKFDGVRGATIGSTDNVNGVTTNKLRKPAK